VPVVEAATRERLIVAGCLPQVVDIDVGIVYYDCLVEGRQSRRVCFGHLLARPPPLQLLQLHL